MDLPPSDKQRYFSLKKGFEGEVKFDLLTSDLEEDKCLILKNLFFDINNTQFQIDTLIIYQQNIIVCEIKYYQDDYSYIDGNFKKNSTGKNITNPLHQLNRCLTLLRQLLQQYGFTLPVEGYVFFNHPEFFLYHSPLNEPMIFPTQLDRFINDLNEKPSNLNIRHQKLAEFLLRKNIEDPPIKKLPSYEYDQLRKGITCGTCGSLLLDIEKKEIICSECGHSESIESAVVRSIEELRLLFPERRITANLVFDWCGLEVLNRKIRRILSSKYQITGHGMHSYYVNRS